MRRTRLPALIGLLSGLLFATPVVAQDFKFNAQHARFDATGTGLAVVNSPDVLPAWRGGAGVLLHVADKPLAFYSGKFGTQRSITGIVQQSSLVVQIHGGFGFGGIADLGVVLPVAPVLVWGPGVDGIPVPGSGDSAAIGDLYLLPKVQFLNPKKTKYVGLGLQVPVGLPTGQGTRYLGDGGVNVALDILAEFRIWKFRVLANISPIHVRPKVEYGDVTRQFGMDWRAGLSFQMLQAVALRAEAFGTVSYVGEAERTTGEWSFSVSLTPGDLVQMELGVGSGLGGFATPGIRAFAGARFTIPQKEEPPPVVEAPVAEPAPEPAPAAEDSTEAVESAVDEAEAVDEGTEVVDEAPAAVEDATEAVDEGTEAVDEGTEAVDEGTEAVDETTEAVDETTEAVDESPEAVEDATGAAEGAAEEATEAIKEASEEKAEEPAPAPDAGE